MKHPTAKRQGFAPKRVTRKQLVDWKLLAKSHKSQAKNIERHKDNQAWLVEFQRKMK